MISNNSTNNVTKATISLLPFSNCQGDITGVTAGTGLSGGGTTGTVELCNADKGSSQNIFKNVASDSGTAVADNNNDTLSILGGTGVSTSVSGDTLTITSSGTSCTGTVTSIDFETNETGTDVAVSGVPITGAGTITLSIPEASATKTGKLSSTDWSTFNSKTTCTGTVTSVGLTAGSGISVSGSPVTGSGSMTVTNSDKGSDQLIFKCIAVSGQSTVVADSNTDTLTLVGSGVTITTNATTDTVTFTATQGDITCVGAGVGLTGGGTLGDVTLCVDYSSSGLIADAPSGTGTPDGDDCILVGRDSSGSGETRSYVLNDLPFTNCTGDITSITATCGLCGGGSSGGVTVCVDYATANNIVEDSPYNAVSTILSTDSILVQNGGSCVMKTTISCLPALAETLVTVPEQFEKGRHEIVVFITQLPPF
jgi:hypothetical protein